jgi:hypothetical protein
MTLHEVQVSLALCPFSGFNFVILHIELVQLDVITFRCLILWPALSIVCEQKCLRTMVCNSPVLCLTPLTEFMFQ